MAYVRFLDDFGAIEVNSLWDDVGGVQSRSDPKVYVVQSPTPLVQRCILATTTPGDLVLDPTCGSGTTAYVAEQWGRRWITIDTSRVALALARARIMGARYPYHLLADSAEGQRKEAELAGRAPAESATHGDIRQDFVYERVPHITLRSIANNAEIDVLHEQHQPAVEVALADLNAALAGHDVPFPVDTGGRKGQQIDFTASGEVTLPSGEPAPANGFLEWEVPREPGTPWPAAQQRLHAAARAAAGAGGGESIEPGDGDASRGSGRGASPAQRRKAERALAELNAAREQAWTFETLPERPVCPWPAAAEAALAAFREARRARQQAIDASIAAKADFEYLYDKPYPDPTKVRVAGPFTVESLSPHRTLAVDENDALIDRAAEARAGYGAEQAFSGMILEQLRTAGVQQAHRDDRITFSELTAWPGAHVCADGRYREGGGESAPERRAAVFVGPEFGTVSRPDLVEAAREAADMSADVLIACAFNYDVSASEFDRHGRIRVLRARMNADLHMADTLKNTGKGNLFVVFGEPDIDVLPADDSGDVATADRLHVKINGVDVFHPQSGEIRSDDADGIACWFIDTDYDQESFFVRHAYFLGANDPYAALRTTLRAQIDADAWASLHSDTSRPFDRPASGRIAVKVINHLGDEVMKVFRV